MDVAHVGCPVIATAQAGYLERLGTLGEGSLDVVGVPAVPVTASSNALCLAEFVRAVTLDDVHLDGTVAAVGGRLEDDGIVSWLRVVETQHGIVVVSHRAERILIATVDVHVGCAQVQLVAQRDGGAAVGRGVHGRCKAQADDICRPRPATACIVETNSQRVLANVQRTHTHSKRARGIPRARGVANREVLLSYGRSLAVGKGHLVAIALSGTIGSVEHDDVCLLGLVVDGDDGFLAVAVAAERAFSRG